MRTATTRRITSRKAEASARGEHQVRAWPYWTARAPRPLNTAGAFFAANLVMLGTWAGAPSSAGLTEAFTVLTGLLVCQVFFYVNGVDRLIVENQLAPFLRRSLSTLALVFACGFVVFQVFPHLAGWQEFLSSMAMSTALLLAMRPLLQFLVRRKPSPEAHLIVGTGPQARRFYTEMTRLRASTAPPGAARLQSQTISPGKALSCSQVGELALRGGFSSVIIAEPNPVRRAELAQALIDCKLRGVEVTEAAESFERETSKVWLEGLRPDLVVYSGKYRPSRVYPTAKRALDVALSVACICLASPLLVAAALAIRLSSPGPVFFRQERVGADGTVFRVCKFRTMRTDAETETGPVWAAEQDSRVTAVGRWLRKYRVDEIPQVFNVLAGDMSFVGPRPERPHFVEMLRERVPFYDLRHYVKPGITGWAQVMYPYGASVEDSYEKLQYDLYYVKHMSLRVDAQVLLRTARVVLQGSGR